MTSREAASVRNDACDGRPSGEGKKKKKEKEKAKGEGSFFSQYLSSSRETVARDNGGRRAKSGMRAEWRSLERISRARGRTGNSVRRDDASLAHAPELSLSLSLSSLALPMLPGDDNGACRTGSVMSN